MTAACPWPANRHRSSGHKRSKQLEFQRCRWLKEKAPSDILQELCARQAEEDPPTGAPDWSKHKSNADNMNITSVNYKLARRMN